MLRPTPEEIAAKILDVATWNDFRGHGMVPGVVSAAFEKRTDEIIGSRIRVTNDDSSTHVEEIVEWRPSERIRLRIGEFSRPLSGLATHFLETWDFSREGTGTRVVRSFELHPKSFVGDLALKLLVAPHLRRAVDRHLLDLA